MATRTKAAWTLLLGALASLAAPGDGIVNPNQQTSNMVIYMRPNELGPGAWRAGVQCLETFSAIYFQGKGRGRERFTRSYNMVLTSAFNMSSPAAQIQDGFLKSVNEAVSERRPGRELFQLRVVSDARPYVAHRMGHGELLLADCYVIVIDALERLRGLLRDYVSHMRSWNPGAPFLVLFNRPEARGRERELAGAIFAELLESYFANSVGVLFATGRTEYSFWTMDYYNSQACRSMRLRRIGGCRDGAAHPDLATVSATMAAYFGSINLENCTFNMCTTISAPFVEADCATGIELRIVGVIKNRLHFQINQSCEEETRGVQEDDGQWTGLLGKLDARDCDFILGGFFPDNEVLDSFWASDTYLADSYTWFAKLADARPPWKALYAIFEDATWLCFVAVLAVAWLSWFFFVNMLPEPRGHGQFSLAGLNALAVTICASVHERPLCNASRVFFLALTLYGLNATTLYTSNLISVFTNPGLQHQIDNIREVFAAGIPFGGVEESRDWFANEDDMWIFERYNDSQLFEPHGANLQAVRRGERVILSSRMFVLQDAIADDLFAFPRNVFSSPLQIVFKPGFPFLLQFNWKIRQMRDGGFFAKIDNDFRFNNTILNRIAKMRPDFQEAVIVLTTDHLQGPFAILVVGVSCSVFFFLAELAFFWCLGPCLSRHCDWDLGVDFRGRRTLRRRHRRKQHSSAERRPAPSPQPQDTDGDDAARTVTLDPLQSLRFTPVKRRRPRRRVVQ